MLSHATTETSYTSFISNIIDIYIQDTMIIPWSLEFWYS